MKVISFNINGLRARLHQLQALYKHQPDVIGLQEIKVHDEAFPLEQTEAMGYHVEFHQAHYGVAMLTKKKPIKVEKGFPTDSDDAQRRMIITTVEDNSGNPVTILNGYFPQGDNISHETKYPYKRQFYADLMTYLEKRNTDEQLIVMVILIFHLLIWI